jgi:lipopolysaccharide transport system ATP-binding protein
MGFMIEMCSRCLWLDRGRLVADGEPASVVQAYRDSIAASEEQMTVRDLGGESATWYADRRLRIDQLKLAAHGSPKSVNVVASGADIDVQAAVAIEKDVPDLAIRLFIERGDGLRVGESRAPAPATRGTFSAAARMSPIGLRPGLYRVDVELIAGKQVAARRSQVFRVVARDSPIGGNPALRHPMVVRSDKARLDAPEDASACGA